MRTAAIFGSTGLIGNHLIQLLSQHKDYNKVYSYARKKPESLPNKIEHIDFNPESFSIPNEVDDVFVCIGTTMKKAGSKEAFRKVDYEMVIEIAKQSRLAKVKRFLVVSSIGADPSTGNFYLKTKGQMEEEVKKVGFDYCGIVRPSLLLGNRKEFRFAEKVSIAVFKFLSFIFVGPLRKYKGINGEDVSKSMIMLAQNGSGIVTIESNILKKIAEEYDKQL